MIDRTGERGLALVVTMMAITLMLALGGALVLLSTSETAIAANYRTAHEATYAADAAIERALADLRAVPDFTAALNGTVQSSFVDGAASGSRRLVDGSTIDLDQITNLANCEKATACSPADLVAVTPRRPWGISNPRWTLYAYGPLTNSLGPVGVPSPFYIVAFVGDDGAESDGDPMVDGAPVGNTPNPGKGVVAIRAEAFGPKNVHSVAEATVARVQMSTELRVLSWRNVR